MQEPSDQRLTLFGCWRLTRAGQAVEVPWRSQRLATLLALRGRQPRPHLAGVLWPDVPEDRAHASLRSALTRLRRHAPGLIQHDHGNLQLADGVAVDVVEFQGLARQVLSGDPREAAAASAYQATVTGGELLPGWYDDWVIAERERVHQLRLHALEALARHLVERGAYAEALEAALTAVGIDPLRESAQRALLEVHLAEGNTAEAVRQYDRFRSILRDELDVAPTHHMAALIARASAGAGARSEHDRGGRMRRQPAWPPRDEAQARHPLAPSALRSGVGTSSG